MRVISGLMRGKRLAPPQGKSTRPTADRLKETLFNILQNDIPGCRLLDVFSGTGALGIEALSRGAEKVVFVDNSRECGELIKRNLSNTPVCDKAVIIVSDFADALNSLGRANEKFNIILLDPPYYNEFTEKAINAILAGDLLDKNGIIVSEQGSNDPVLEFSGIHAYNIRKYKTTAFVFYAYSKH